MKAWKVVDIVGDYCVALALNKDELLGVFSTKTTFISRRSRCVSAQPNCLGNEGMYVFVKVQPNGGYVLP